MLKNTVTGSVLARMFPTMSKYFLENASQEEVNKAEQEAAVIHQQLNGLGESGGAEASANKAVTAGNPAAEPKPADSENQPMAGTPERADLTAMTTLATTAEASVTRLTTALNTAEAERDKYKAWYDKQAGKGTALPGADATTRGGSTEGTTTLSAASTDALNLFRKRQAKA